MAEAEYHRVEDPEEDSPPGEEELLLHVTEGRQGSWHHIKNLDDFFTKISSLGTVPTGGVGASSSSACTNGS
uniref:Autophagy related 9B n=1 Tax=Pavo cristatus TaxID=9049 RepID=A0A8C9EWR8_PAVCR